jgi:hypothetical protein
MAKGTEKEKEEWSRQDRKRPHDMKVLWEAKDIVEEKFIKPIRDE